MTRDELLELIETLRHYRTDGRVVEAKRCSTDEVPKSVRDTLSAFSNSPGGGVIILGLDEADGFAASGVANVSKISADLGSLARTAFEPPLTPEITHHEVEGADVVVAEVPELPPGQKPAYIKAMGMTTGSYRRVHDGDCRMTAYEVQLVMASRGQPRDDEQPVDDAGPGNLDEDLVRSYAENLRRTRVSVFGEMSTERILEMTKVLVKAGRRRVPSVAGLLAFGIYPQEFFPQINATFVAYPTDDGQPLASGERFLDNVIIEGNVPTMLRQAQVAIRRNMTRRAVVTARGRADVWDYPEEALREVLVNALVHRDLSDASRGTPVQIEMFPSFLQVRNPGGLFGPVRLDQLGDEGISSSRNATLLKILEDVPVLPENRSVCENRGSGIRVMIGALRGAGMSVPQFQDRVSSFVVRFPRHTLLSEDVISWIRALGQEDLTDSQHTALALLRQDGRLDNPTFRAVVGIDSRQATAELQDLVARELVVQQGKSRWASYTLSPTAEMLTELADGSIRLKPADRRVEILRALGSDQLSRRQIEQRTGLSHQVVYRWLRVLLEEGRVQRTAGPAQSKNTQYWATNPTVHQPHDERQLSLMDLLSIRDE